MPKTTTAILLVMLLLLIPIGWMIHRSSFNSGVLAQTSLILDMPGATFQGHVNELTLDGKASFDDPVKIRQGAANINNRDQYLGAFSGDLLKGSRQEKILIALKKNADESGLVEVFLQSPGGTEDRTMQRKLSIFHDKIIAWVPIVMPDGTVIGAPPAPPSSCPASDAFATALCGLYTKYYMRLPTLQEIDSNRGNPNGITGVEQQLRDSLRTNGRL